MFSDVDSAVGRLRDWHLSVTDFGKAVQSDWNDEVASLNDELAKALEARLSTLTAEIRSAVEAVDAEWATVSLDQFTLRDLSAFDSVWGNRLARASIGICSAVAVMAAGAFIGGPVGLAIAIAGGPAAGIALTPLKNLVDRIFLGKDGVLRERRQEVAKQVGPILDDLTEEYQKVVATRLDELRDGLASERKRSAEHSKSLEDLAARWTNHSQGVRELIREIDLGTTSALLRMNGRERLARSVTRATRVPGVCILAEFEDAAFWEAWLFPPDLGETLAGGKAPIRGGESASALAYALSLAEAGFQLTKANDASALLTTDADLPTAIVETWSGALTAHVGRPIQIETNRRTSHQ
jgi:gas vesicle protein